MSNLKDSFLKNNLDQSIRELVELCRVKSVSAINQEQAECAALLKEMLVKRGFQVALEENGGAPIVVAERNGRSPKTILFYNHYDVQPAEPLDLWVSPPFEPQIRDGKLYARGAADDKGHIVNRLFALDALLAEDGDLPCGVKFLIEGEEETTSESLKKFMQNGKSHLTADACIWEYGGVDQNDSPMQYLGVRGICYFDLTVESANQDIHSGFGGSIFQNAAWRLVWALASLKSPDEHIHLPGFYDSVLPIRETDRQLLEKLTDPAENYKLQYGVKEFLNGVSGGVDLLTAETFLPTCTICGLTSGYQGAGAKTVLPAKASAKVEFRLVPNQKPEDVEIQLRNHLDQHGFSDIKVELLCSDSPSRTEPENSFVQLVARMAEEVYGKPGQLVPMIGGSGPNHIVSENLHIPIASLGIGDPESRMHAPNENIRLDLYLKGAMHTCRVLEEFGRL